MMAENLERVQRHLQHAIRERDSLRAEVKRLREALAELYNELHMWAPNPAYERTIAIKRKVKALLEGKENRP